MPKKRSYFLLTVVAGIFCLNFSFAQLVVNNTNPNNNPTYLVQNVLMGNGVTATNIVFGGNANQQIGYFNGVNSNIGLDSGIVLSTGDVQNSAGPNSGNTSDNISASGSDVDLNTIVGSSSGNQDKAVLEFDFIPIGDSVEFQYVFASEEYHDYVNTSFNDVFGFFISGPGITGPYSNNSKNIALIPGTTTPVSINNVNNGQNSSDCLGNPPGPCVNCTYFFNNCGGATVEYDGFTTVLVAKAIVQCGETYHIKMAIQDVADGSLNSAVFLKAQSFSSPGIQISLNTVLGDNNMIEGCADATIDFIRPISDTDSVAVVYYEITGTATNGVDYTYIPDSVVLGIGQDTASILISLLSDLINEGVETLIITVHNVIPCTGDTIDEVATISIFEGYDLTMNSVNDTILCGKDPASIASTATGGTVPYTYNWDNGMSGSPITVFPAATDSFIVTAYDKNGCKGKDTIIVFVTFPQPVAFAGSDDSICIGSSLVLGGSPTGPPGSVYSWSPSGTLSSSTASNPTATPVITTQYIVSIVDTNTCTNKDTMVVTVFSLPLAKAGNDTSICTGATVQIGGSPTGPTGSVFSWSPAGTLNNPAAANPQATPAGNTTYTVTVTDTNGCVKTDDISVSLFALPVAVASNDTSICTGDTVQLSSSGGVGYAWGPSLGLSSTIISNPKAFPSITSTFIVSVTDNNNCVDTESVKITVNNLPVVDAGTNTSICIGDTIQIGGSPTGPAGSGFLWAPNTSISSLVDSNPTVFPSATITYFLTVTDVNTCSKNDSVKITVNSLPAVDAGNDTSICTGNSVIIGGSPTSSTGISFTWMPSGTLNIPTLANPTATPFANTTYIVTVTDGNSCKNSDTIDVSLFSAVTATASNDTSICPGDTITLFSSGGVSYLWSPSSGLSSDTVSNPEAFPMTTTTYSVTVSDVNSCIDIETVVVGINDLPIVNAGNDTAICVGDSIMIGGSPTGPAGSGFLWTPDSTISSIVDSNPTVFPAATITYFLTVTDINTCTKNDSILITVNSLPLVDAGDDTTICDGVPVVLGGNPTGPDSSSFSWAPATSLSSTIDPNPTATPSAGITYMVTVTDTNSCVNSDDVVFIVNANPVADAGAGGIICVGDSLPLSGSGGILYHWIPADSLTDAFIFNPISFPSDTQIYYLEVTDGNNCKDTDSVTVNVNPLPLAEAGPDLWICPFDSIQIVASGGVIYSWSPVDSLSDPNVFNPIAFPSDTSEYFVTVTDINGCVNTDSLMVDVGLIVPTDAGPDKTICIFDSVQIGGSPTSPAGSTFSWNTSSGLSDTAIANPVAFPPDTIIYYVTTTNFTCTGLDSVVVNVNPLPIVDAGANVPVCIFDTIQLNATGGVSFVWTPSDSLSDDSIANPLVFPSDTTEYFVTATDINGCVNNDSVTVVVNPLPSIVITSDIPICLYDSIQLNASGGVFYVWLPADSLTDDSISNPVAFPSDTTNYIVTVEDVNGCINHDSVLVTVNPLPVIGINSDFAICTGDTALLNATGGDVYTWLPVTGLSDPNIAGPFAFPLDTTTYVVTVIDSNTCVNQDSVTITVNPLPLIDAGLNVPVCIYDTVQLLATGGLSYAWVPADSLSDDSIADPFAFPSDTTEYFVTGTDTNGCVNFDSVTIIINPLPVAAAFAFGTSCNGDSDGVAIVNVSGGTPLYNFLWSNSGINDTITNLPPGVFFVTVTDINGCSDTSTATVSEPSAMAINITGNNSSCNGEPDGSATVSPSGGTSPYTFLWSNSANTITISSLNAGSYFVTVTDANGCTDSSGIIITEPFVLSANPTSAGASCFGFSNGSASVSPSGGTTPYTIAWDNGGSSGTISNLVAGTYSVTVTDANACFSTDSVVVSEPAEIITTISATDATCYLGNDGSASVSVSGGISPYSYLWSTFPPQMLVTASGLSAGTYSVIITDDFGCVDSAITSISEPPLLAVSVSAIPTEICVGDSTQLSASGGVDYFWLPPDSLTDDSTSGPMAFPSVTTTYVVLVADSDNCKNTDSITITVNPLPSNILGNDLELCIGDSVQITATGGDNYSWIPTNSLDNPSVSNPFAFPSDTTLYVVTVVDSNGCTNSDSITIEVNPIPAADAGISDTICLNDSVQVLASGGETYLWVPGTGLSDVNISDPMASPGATTLYYATVTDSNSCTGIDSVLIVVNQLPVADAGPDSVTACSGDTVQLNASGGIIFLWDPPTGLSNINIPNPVSVISGTEEYFVSVTDSNNCSNIDSITVAVFNNPAVDAGVNDTMCAGDTVLLSASGGISYSWSPAGSLSNPAVSGPFAFPLLTTEYFVNSLDSNGCSGVDSVEVFVNQLPSVDAGNDMAICFGDTVQLSATGAVGFSWSPSLNLSNPAIPDPLAYPASTSEYFVSGTDGNNCVNIDSITISVNALPVAEAGNDTSICSGASLQLSASGGVNYLWWPNLGLNNPNISNPLATLTSDSVEYFVTATDINGCKAIDSLLIRAFFIEVSPDTGICFGDSAFLYANVVAGYAPYIFSWSPSGTLTDTSLANPVAGPFASITYFVTVSESSGCSDSGEVRVTVNSNPIADFTFKLEPSCVGAEASFKNNSQEADSYLWVFGDGKTSTKENPEHQFLYNQMMDVTLIAINTSGCDDSSFVSQSIKSFDDYFDIVVPNVFTPNGDGINDWFEIRFENKLQECTDVQIFNRWGELIFGSSATQHSWNGRTFAGEEAANGTYFFVFDINGKEFKGAVMLIR